MTTSQEASFPEIPGYEIQRELGRGGMAVVYAAIEAELGREVAIKVVRSDGPEPGHIQRLENEARGLAALHHPHIVDLYRFGRTADGALFYVMPLLQGGSLEERPRPMPEAEVVALLDKVLDALTHAHASDIVHRDIKPGNILFDRHGRPMLADFGAAFMRKRDQRITTHGGAIGSSGYMSPEQARGLEVDARSDLYSTAVLAFELLTGARPFDGPDGLAIALAQLEKPVPRLPPELKHWQAFFDKALSVGPAARYADAGEMRAAMHGLRKSSYGGAGRSPVPMLVAALVLSGVAIALWKHKASNEPVRAPASPVAANVSESAAPMPAAPSTVMSAEPLPAPARPTKVGDRFSDPGGPPMVLARAAKGSQPALAVMAAPVDVPLYKRYLQQRKQSGIRCSNPAAPAQGCLGLPTANELAKWLGEETGEKYRVPTRPELAASTAQVVRANAYAWTQSCNEVRVYHSRNAAQRGWARVRKVFGKPKPVPYELRCDGHYALKLDGRGETARALEGGPPEAVVVLVRELRAK
jgi:hypothetical protein